MARITALSVVGQVKNTQKGESVAIACTEIKHIFLASALLSTTPNQFASTLLTYMFILVLYLPLCIMVIRYNFISKLTMIRVLNTRVKLMTTVLVIV